LVKYQLFIEGEQVVLVTDHAALQWARVYENVNRRLAAWGAVFAAYPGLKIVHRPGRIHSNVDPLSRLPRIRPHSSPVLDDIPSIVPDESKQQRAQGAEDEDSRTAVKKAVFCAMWWDEVVDKFEAYPIQTCRQAREAEELGRVVESLATPSRTTSLSLRVITGRTPREKDRRKEPLKKSGKSALICWSLLSQR
jgi:hypothetical protein